MRAKFAVILGFVAVSGTSLIGQTAQSASAALISTVTAPTSVPAQQTPSMMAYAQQPQTRQSVPAVLTTASLMVVPMPLGAKAPYLAMQPYRSTEQYVRTATK